ncbi:MAG: metallophosphoesterase [Bacilli bacterium]|nr:metallophosphoesterase [Bacilli bacterium]
MTREELNQKKQQEIFFEQKHEKRKKLTLFIFKLSFAIIIGFIVFYLYTTFVSARIISVHEERIINKKIPDSFNGLKIVQFSDLHFGTTFFEKEVKDVVNKINLRKPDIVVFTGDLIDKDYSISTNDQEKLIKQLKKIDASLGKYAIYGEEDNNTFETIMRQSEFEILDNSYDVIYNNSDDPLLLVGLNTKDGQLNIDDGFAYFKEPTHNANAYTITLLHKPDITDQVLDNFSSDLFLSGHSHNGYIVVPFVGGIYKNSEAKKYNSPYYKLDDSELFISSGLGTNGPGFRLFCRPSINFFRLSNR